MKETSNKHFHYSSLNLLKQERFPNSREKKKDKHQQGCTSNTQAGRQLQRVYTKKI